MFIHDLSVTGDFLGRLAVDEANLAPARREFEAALLRDPNARPALERLQSQSGPFAKS